MRWNGPRSRSPRCSRAACDQGAAVKAPYFWSDQYGSRIQFAGIAAPRRRDHHRGGRLRRPLLPRHLPARRPPGRRARRRPAAPVHPLAPPARHGARRRLIARPVACPYRHRDAPTETPRFTGAFDRCSQPSRQPDLHPARPLLHRPARSSRWSRRRSSRRCGSAPCGPRDLDKPGAFRTVQVGRESVLVTRTRKGDVRASSTSAGTAAPSCAPRRAARSSGPSSARTTPGPTTSTASSIAAPNLTKMPDIDRTEYGLRTIARARVARLRVGVPGRRAAVVRGRP